MEHYFPDDIRDLQEQVEGIVRESIAPRASEMDEQSLWPKHTFDALADAGLLGLHVPEELGGKGLGLLALSVITEVIGSVDPSSAICFGMHCVGTAVIAAKATDDHKERYLRPIAKGEHITTLALSEPGTGAEFYFPQTTLTRQDDEFLVNGSKAFITNGDHAHSYVLSTMATEEANTSIGEFSCLVLDKETKGMEWGDAWSGFGMRGNSSRGLQLSNVAVPCNNLLGKEGEQTWYVFEVVAPYFLIAMAGTYLGAAQGAYDCALHHLQNRMHDHSQRSLAQIPILQNAIAQLWIELQKTRSLVYKAGFLGDLGTADALHYILSCKADVARTATHIVNEAMTLCGGMAYGENAHLARLLRDVRAAHVMSPTTFILDELTGRSLLGLPLL
jgi:isovaleryl-CoA dehydrogenase